MRFCSHCWGNEAFARSLLAEGLHLPTGTRDVMVIPRRRCLPDSVRIVLKSTAGAALVDIAASTVGAAVAAALRLGPEKHAVFFRRGRKGRILWPGRSRSGLLCVVCGSSAV
ncbi:SsgA family sporulation/cell division regulator [Streptomyces atratus]|uniref:SsgA family sporulation/cell division regulator n=1 Tax=Streptomyces atratus TaxID=1893 RepID=UPI0033900268